METEPAGPRPSRAVWFAWTLAFVGGLVVAGAAIRVLLHPCVRTVVTCTDDALTFTSRLALVGTVAAVGGGVAAMALVLRRR